MNAPKINGIIFMLALTACLPEPLPVDNIPVVKPGIVVSAQIIPDESLVVLLTKNFGALEANDDSDPAQLVSEIALNDAVVSVEGPTRKDTLLFLGTGVYGGINIDFQSGQSYTLHIHSATLGDAHATTTVKPLVRFASVTASLFNTGYDTLAEVHYSISDPFEKNWYMVSAQQLSRDDLQERLLNPRIMLDMLDDKNFQGERFEKSLKVITRRDFEPGDTLLVTLSNIGKDYYDFMTLREDTRYSFVDFLSEPVNYPSNVEGGLGFFNLYLPDAHIFIMEE